MPNDKCSNCGNSVGLNSTRCTFCGKDLPQITDRPWIGYVKKFSYIKIEQQVDVKLFTCPFCFNKSFFKHLTSSYYECLNLQCKAIGHSTKYVKSIELDGDSIYVFQLNR